METGIGLQNPLFFIGVVENNNDPHVEGRVKVRAFSIHGNNKEVPATDLPWAICAKGDYDPNGVVPPLNSFVWGMFLDGRDAQHPIVLGLIPSMFAEEVNPDLNGWGVIPDKDGDLVARGARPKDYGNPQNSKLARGEYINETYVASQEMKRVEDIKIAGDPKGEDGEPLKFSEPNSAYNAKYPHNRVIETSKHSIEIDDTPGAERIMVHHGSGSYVQIDNRGTTTNKAVGDKYEINDKQQHVYVGGPSIVTINSDAYVYVNGNKTEEISGDYNLIVRGNYQVGVGQSLFLNSTQQIQARAADIMIDANVGALEMFAKEETKITAGIQLNMTAKKIFSHAAEEWHAVSDSFLKLQSTDGMWINSVEGGLNMKTLESIFVETDETVSIRAGNAVNVDPGSGLVDLASGSAGNASAAEAEIAEVADQAEMPEPPTAGTAIGVAKISSMNNPGIIATDDAVEDQAFPDGPQ